MIDTSAQNALKNSVYNFLGFILPAVVLVFFTPIIISKLGVKEYGIFVFLNTAVTFLGLLELGVGTATSKHLIEYNSTKQENKLKHLIYSMNSVYAILGFIYLFICIAIGLVVKYLFFYNASTSENYFLLFLIVGLISFVNAFFANFNNFLVAIQRYDLHLKLSLLFFLLTNLATLIMAVMGYKLTLILSVHLLLAILSCLSYMTVSKRVFPLMCLKYGWSKEEIFKNYKFGFSVAFNNLAVSSLVHFDKLIVPIFVGPSQLTYYSVPGGIATRTSTISATLSVLLFPITVSLHSTNQLDKIKRVYIRSVRLITILSAAISFSIIFMADKILLYWLNENFAKQSVYVLIILVLTNFVLAIFSPLSYLLTAMNKMKFLTTGSVVMAVANIIALFVLLPIFGINGAAIAYLIGVIPVFYMFFYAENKYFGTNYLNSHLKLFLKLLITVVPSFVIERFLIYPQINSFAKVIILGPVCVFLFLLIYKIFGFVELEDWQDFLTFFGRFLKKIKFKF